jgi:hypothetical protein
MKNVYSFVFILLNTFSNIRSIREEEQVDKLLILSNYKMFFFLCYLYTCCYISLTRIE